MDRPDARGSPLFTFTAYSAFISVAVGVALLLIWSAWAFFPKTISAKPPGDPVAAAVIVFDLSLLGLGLAGLHIRVWRVRFFDKGFAVRARGVKKEFPYSQVTGVHIYLVSSGLVRRQVLRIDMEDGEPVTITANPKNKVLKTDLYHWLRDKTEFRVTTGAVSSAPEGLT
ncbi:MAG: hypothetical protein OK456_00265 [Thaumarchaeota archaeon]|nr:hypothetical protein [Nitrososphaerota archaeon]